MSQEVLREEFIQNYIAPYITNELVLNAFRTVDRGDFTPPGIFPYSDNIVPLGKRSSLSEPSLVAAMIDILNPTGRERVLEVGTGSGYSAAVLSRCASEVHTIEYDRQLSKAARRRLVALGFDNVTVHRGDGAQGVPKYSPYDAVIATAGMREIPQALFDQLKDDGVVVAPTIVEVINRDYLCIVRGVKQGNTLRLSVFYPVEFHSLISDAHGGWSPKAIAKRKSYEVVFDDKVPKKFKPKRSTTEDLVEETNIKPTEEAVEVLRSFGMTPEEFMKRLEQVGTNQQGPMLLTLHPEAHPEALTKVLKLMQFWHKYFSHKKI